MMNILILLLISSVNSITYNCRPNCEICDPILNGTCLQCFNNKWGDMCQYDCQCSETCDVNTSRCIVSIKMDKKIDDTPVRLFIFGVMLIMFLTFAYKVINVKHFSKY